MPLTTFEKGCQIARAMEMTEKNGHECRPATSNARDERQGCHLLSSSVTIKIGALTFPAPLLVDANTVIL